VAVLLFAVSRIVSPARHEAEDPTTPTSTPPRRSSRRRRPPPAYLVYLRDKALLFDEQRRGFVMYGRRRADVVALGIRWGPQACTHT